MPDPAMPHRACHAPPDLTMPHHAVPRRASPRLPRLPRLPCLTDDFTNFPSAHYAVFLWSPFANTNAKTSDTKQVDKLLD